MKEEKNASPSSSRKCLTLDFPIYFFRFKQSHTSRVTHTFFLRSLAAYFGLFVLFHSFCYNFFLFLPLLRGVLDAYICVWHQIEMNQRIYSAEFSHLSLMNICLDHAAIHCHYRVQRHTHTQDKDTKVQTPSSRVNYVILSNEFKEQYGTGNNWFDLEWYSLILIVLRSSACLSGVRIEMTQCAMT